MCMNIKRVHKTWIFSHGLDEEGKGFRCRCVTLLLNDVFCIPWKLMHEITMSDRELVSAASERHYLIFQVLI